MKISDWINWHIIPFTLICGLAAELHADVPNPTGTNAWLNSWSFGDTNSWTSDYGYAPISYTNLASYAANGLLSLVLDSTNAAWLQYNVYEPSDGTTNLTVDRGSLYCWFAPSWLPTNHGGTGPGQWGRLIEVGAFGTNSTSQWWSLYLDPGGTNIYFSAITNGIQTNYL